MKNSLMFLDYEVAKSEDVKFMNIRIDFSTGAMLDQADTRVVSTWNAISIPDKAKQIRVNLSFTGIWDDTNVREGIIFYDENDKFVSSTTLSDDDHEYGYIDVPEGAKKLRMSLYDDEHGLQPIDDSKATYELKYPEVLIYYGGVLSNPHYSKLSKKLSKENGQMFFRETLSGNITLHGEDFGRVAGMNVNDIARFRIFALRDSSYVKFYESDIQKTGCKIDYTTGKVTLPTSDFDEYTNLLDNYENEYDILKKDLAYEPVSMLRKAMVQAYLWGENTVSNIIDNVYWSEDTTETVVDINELISSYHFVLPIIAEVTSATIGAYDENEKPSDDSKAAIDAMVGKYYGYQYYSKAQNRYCYYLRNRSGYTLVLKYTESNHKYNITYKKGDKTYGYKENWSASIEPDCWLDITYMDMPNDPHCYIDTKLSHTESLKVYLRYVIETSNVISGFEENDNQYVLSTSKTNQSSEYDPFLDSDTEYDTALDFDIGMVVTSNSQTAPDVAELRSFGYYGTPVPICKAAWTDELSYWYVESKTTADYGDALAYTKTVKHCYSLGTVIKALLADCAPELSFEETSEYSEFLYGSGVLCSELNSLNSVFRIFFAPMTNVTKEDYDTPAKKCTLSLKVILDMLKNAYQCYPFIENGKLRLEHLIYFVRGHSYKGYSRTLDFVSLRDKFNGRHTIFGQSEVSYSVDSLSSRYEFSWSDEGTDYFNDYALDLKGGITKGLDTEQISISTFSTDVNLMVAFPENFSDDSVALLCVDSNNKVVSRAINVITPEGDSQYIGLQNYYASWLYCVTLYRWYVYPSTNIEVNDNNRIAETSKDVKTADFMQVTINLPRVVTDSITNYQIITDVGTGYVDSATENLDSGFISATLNIEPK